MTTPFSYMKDQIEMLQSDLDKANARIAQLEEALIVANEKSKLYSTHKGLYVDVLAESSDTWLSDHDKAVEQAFVKALRSFPSIGLSERQFGELKAVAESRK